MEVLGDLRGGAEPRRRRAASILGGHSIDDPEPKYGMAVTGLVHPSGCSATSARARATGSCLTKPLGTGHRSRPPSSAASPARALRRPRRAGDGGAEPRRRRGARAIGAVHALTDVTGFGLLGHVWEMAEGSGVAIRLRAAAIPVLDGVRELAAQDVVPGGSKANLAWVAPHVRFGAGARRRDRAPCSRTRRRTGACSPPCRPAPADAALRALERGGRPRRPIIGDVAAGPRGSRSRLSYDLRGPWGAPDTSAARSSPPP